MADSFYASQVRAKIATTGVVFAILALSLADQFKLFVSVAVNASIISEEH